MLFFADAHTRAILMSYLLTPLIRFATYARYHIPLIQDAVRWPCMPYDAIVRRLMPQMLRATIAVI